MPTELLTYTTDTEDKITRSYAVIRDGIAGNIETVMQMIRLVRKDSQDKGIRAIAVEILRANRLTAHSYVQNIFSAIFHYVKNEISYINDEAGRVEEIKNSRITLADKYGDCDDLAILTASLLAALGFNPYFVLAKYNDNPNSPYDHIYVVVYDDDTRYVFDPVIPNGDLNDEEIPLKSLELGVFDTHQGIDSIQGVAAYAFKNLTNTAHSLAGVAKAILPLSAPFVPGLNIAASVSRLIPEQQNRIIDLSSAEFQQVAKEFNKELNNTIYGLFDNYISKDAALSVTAKIQQAINNLNADTQNERVIKESIQNRINFINSFEGGAPNINQDTMLLITLGVTGAAVGYAIYKNSVKKYV